MSSVELNRNVLFSRKVVMNRQLQRRCLNGRRSISHESEGTLPPGYDDQGEGEGTCLREASEVMRISYRQGRRIYKRYREEGDRGLVHRNRGQPSNRRKAFRIKRGGIGHIRGLEERVCNSSESRQWKSNWSGSYL